MSVALKTAPQPVQQEKIETEVQAIVSHLVERLPQDCEPRCVLWHGSFARGESGLYRYGERWLPFGDYDLEFICNHLPGRQIIHQLEESLLERFGYRSVLSPVEETLVEDASSFNVIDLKFSTPEQLAKRSPDLSTYDLLHSSQVMYGEDLRPAVQLKIEKVPLFSAYRILHNRLFNLVSLFGLDLWEARRTLTHQEKVAFSLAICRTWLDFGMALSLCLGVYAPDYATRLENLEREGERISLWFKDWKGLLEGIRVAMQFKQKPMPEKLDTNAIRRGYFLVLQSWDRVMRVVQGQLLPYYFGRGYEMDRIDYWSEAAEICQKILPRRYYRDYLRVMLSTRENTPSDLTLDVCSYLANIHENYNFRGVSFLIRHPKRSLISPEIIYFAAIPLLAFSITQVGKVQYGMLNQVMQLISPYRKCRVALMGRENWKEVKDFCVDLFSDYRQKQKKSGARHLPHWLLRK